MFILNKKEEHYININKSRQSVDKLSRKITDSTKQKTMTTLIYPSFKSENKLTKIVEHMS